MLETFIDRRALLWVDRQHLVDEIQSWISDRVPVRRRIVEAGELYLLGEGVGIIRGVQLVGERRKTTKADVEYHSERPNIDSPSVPAMLGVF